MKRERRDPSGLAADPESAGGSHPAGYPESAEGGKLSAGEITDHFPITAAAVSRHLSVLKDADLINDTREGKYIFYELNASVLEEILLWINDLRGVEYHD